MLKTTTKVAGLLLAGASVMALTLAGALPADAARAKKQGKQVRAPATVVAVGRSRPQVVVGQVRLGRWGQEVRLPGGTWIDCKGDCRETLREETVDWWERQENKGSTGRTPR